MTEHERDCTRGKNGSLGELRPPERRRKDLDALVQKGFKALKILVHSATLKEDIRVVEGAACFVENRLRLRLLVDANQSWPVSLVKRTPVWDLERARGEGTQPTGE